MQNDSEKLSKAVEISKEKFTKLSNSVTAYAQTFSELKQAAKNMNTPAKTVIALNDKLQELLASIPAEFAIDIAGATTSEELETAMAEILNKEAKKQLQAEIGLSIQTSIDETEGILSYLRDTLGDGAKDLKLIFTGLKGSIKLDRVVADMRKGLDFRGLAKDMGDAAKATNLETANRGKFIEILGAEYGATADMQLMLRELAHNDLKKFQEAVLASARAAQRNAEMQQRIALFKEAETNVRGVSELRDSIERLNANLSMENTALGKIGGGVGGLLDPKGTLSPINESINNAAEALMSPAADPRSGTAGLVQQGKAMTEIIKAQMAKGAYIPQMDETTGDLGGARFTGADHVYECQGGANQV